MIGPVASSTKSVLVAASLAAEPCVRGVARWARQQDWQLASDMIFTGTFPRGWKGDGIVAVAGYQPELLRDIENAGVPCVMISMTDETAPFPCVKGDQVEVGRMAADHLLERAYRNFVWAPFINDQINREQFLGFETRLAEYGYSCQLFAPAHRRIGGFWHDDWESYRRGLLAKIQQFTRPTAIFAANASVATCVLEACRALGFAVPDRVAVISVGGDSALGEALAPQLSTVELAVEALAFRAAEVLSDVMAGKTVPKVTLVSPQRVVTRASTDTCAVANPQIAKALNCIAERFSEPMLSVADVAEAVGVSRRQLERGFRAATGCTVHDYLLKRRMQEASRLLRSHPRAKVSDIAGLVGLGHSGSFFRTFRRFFGVSPKLHRENGVHLHPGDERALVPAKESRLGAQFAMENVDPVRPVTGVAALPNPLAANSRAEIETLSVN